MSGWVYVAGVMLVAVPIGILAVSWRFYIRNAQTKAINYALDEAVAEHTQSPPVFRYVTYALLIVIGILLAACIGYSIDMIMDGQEHGHRYFRPIKIIGYTIVLAFCFWVYMNRRS